MGNVIGEELYFYILISIKHIMWDLEQDFSKIISSSLPTITFANAAILLTALVTLRFILDKVLNFYFQIH